MVSFDYRLGTIVQPTTVKIQMVQKMRVKCLPHPHSSLCKSVFRSQGQFCCPCLTPQGHLSVLTGRGLLLASIRQRPRMLHAMHRVGPPTKDYPAQNVIELRLRNTVRKVSTIASSFLYIIPGKNFIPI